MRLSPIPFVVARIVDSWKALGLEFGPGCEEQVTRFKRLHDLELPSAFEMFYLAQGGMSGGATDEKLLRFWPLIEIRPVRDHPSLEHLPSSRRYFEFMDWSIWAHTYAVDLASAEGDVVLLGGPRVIPVAGSFAELLRLYANNPADLL